MADASGGTVADAVAVGSGSCGRGWRGGGRCGGVVAVAVGVGCVVGGSVAVGVPGKLGVAPPTGVSVTPPMGVACWPVPRRRYRLA